MAPSTQLTVGGLVTAERKLSVTNLVKTFPGGRGGGVVAIDGIDLHVDSGELVCIVGASGCGKSTLLNIVGGLEQHTSGEVEIDGEPVIGPGPDRGMVFQSYSLYPWKTVAQNVSFGLECARTPKAGRRDRVDELLAIMGLAEFADHRPAELSGGMRQRVAIARALAPEPDVLLLDEPFGALDAQTKKSMQDFLLTVWRRTGSTILMVTHDVEESIYLSQRIYVLTSRPGRVGAVVDVPFGRDRGPLVKRDPRFLDLRDEIEDLLLAPHDGGLAAAVATPATHHSSQSETHVRHRYDPRGPRPR
ncbi:MAG: ABC transporter ATP-binding protein [Actinomycetota bacterium]